MKCHGTEPRRSGPGAERPVVQRGARRHGRPRSSRAFTLVEALVAVAITAMAGAAILLAIETSVRTAKDSVDRTIAQGMAAQILDEVLGQRYAAEDASPYAYPLGPTPWEQAGGGRQRFNETGDFNGFVAHGAVDLWGQPLGEGDGEGGLRHPNFRAPAGFFRDWQQQVEVYYVDQNDLSVRLPPYQASNYRAVQVTISRVGPDGTVRPLANLRRVYAYVAKP